MPRVFFALCPDHKTCDQLANLTSGISTQKVVKPANLHLTLQFIGYTNTLTCLIKQASTIRCSPFELNINQFGLFNRARVLWVGPTKYPGELSRLANDCYQVASQCGSNKHVEHFTPHISLIRKIKNTPKLPDFQPIKWSVNKFSLMLSESDKNGVQYSVIETFLLHF